MLKKFGTVIIVCLFVTACDSTHEIDTKSSASSIFVPSSMSSGTQYTVDPSHSLNPYDYVGQYHNEGVAAVLNAFDESQGDLGSQLPMLSTDFMNSLGFEVDNSIYPILAGSNYFVSGWEGTIADQIASDMGFSSQAEGFLNALIGYVTSFDYSVPGDLSLISDIKVT